MSGQEERQHDGANDAPRGRDGLTGKVFRGSTHQGMLGFLAQGLSLAQTMILARVFFPEEFGTLAAALAYLHFFVNLGQHGISKNLIREETLNAKTVGTALALSLGRDFALLAIYLLGLVPFVTLFDRPDLMGYLLILAPLVMLNTLELPAAFLEREFRFKAVNIPRFIELVTYPAIAVALHASGIGEKSLFLAYTASFLLSRATLWFLFPVPLDFRFDRAAASRFASFSAPIMMAAAVTYLANKLDDLFVMSFAGEEALGYYALAFYKPMFIIALVNMVGSVLFSAFSRVRDESDRVRAYFVHGSRFLAMFVFPAGFLVAAFAEPIVVELFSERWRPAAELLRFFAIGIALRVGLTALWIPLVTSRGPTRAPLVSSIVDLGLLLALGLPLIARFGANGGAWYFVLHAVLSVWIVPLPAVRRIVGDLGYLRMLVLPLGATLLATAAALGLEQWMPGGGLPGLAAKGLACLTFYALLLLLGERRSLPTALRFVRMAGAGPSIPNLRRGRFSGTLKSNRADHR